MKTTEPASPCEPLLLTVVEAAAMLGVGRTTMYELLARGDLVAVRIGRARRVRIVDLQLFVEQLADGMALR